jgi:hypothetical protein
MFMYVLLPLATTNIDDSTTYLKAYIVKHELQAPTILVMKLLSYLYTFFTATAALVHGTNAANRSEHAVP